MPSSPELGCFFWVFLSTQSLVFPNNLWEKNSLSKKEQKERNITHNNDYIYH